jgi:hypothetical protein
VGSDRQVVGRRNAAARIALLLLAIRTLNKKSAKAGRQGLASAPLEATRPGFSWRKPSGIPAAAVVDRGALVSSSFPAR